jgi:hypothetical protein
MNGRKGILHLALLPIYPYLYIVSIPISFPLLRTALP